MSEISIIWLKALVIELVSAPWMYVCMFLYINLIFIASRNTKGNLRGVTPPIVRTLFPPFFVIPMFFLVIPLFFALKLGVGVVPYSHNAHWVFLLFVVILHALSVSPALWYLRKRWSDLEELGRSHPWVK